MIENPLKTRGKRCALALAITGGRNVRLRWYDPTSGNFTVISASEPKNPSRSVPYAAAHEDGSDDLVLVVEGV